MNWGAALDFFKQSCANELAFNMGIMMAAVWHLTGMVIVGLAITGRDSNVGSAKRLDDTAKAPGP